MRLRHIACVRPLAGGVLVPLARASAALRRPNCQFVCVCGPLSGSVNVSVFEGLVLVHASRALPFVVVLPVRKLAGAHLKPCATSAELARTPPISQPSRLMFGVPGRGAPNLRLHCEALLSRVRFLVMPF